RPDPIRNLRHEVARNGHALGVMRRLIARAGDQIPDPNIGHIFRNREHAPGQSIPEVMTTGQFRPWGVSGPAHTRAAQLRPRRRGGAKDVGIRGRGVRTANDARLRAGADRRKDRRNEDLVLAQLGFGNVENHRLALDREYPLHALPPWHALPTLWIAL